MSLHVGLRSSGWFIVLSLVGASLLSSCGTERPDFSTGTGGTPGDGDGDTGGSSGDGDGDGDGDTGGSSGDGDGDGDTGGMSGDGDGDTGGMSGDGDGDGDTGGKSGDGDGDGDGDTGGKSGDGDGDGDGDGLICDGEDACGVECPKNGSDRVCTTDCPCGVGAGVCTNTDQCDEALVCTPDAEAKLNFPGSSCLPAHCVNDVQDSGETSVDCGGGCGCRATYEVVQISGVPSDADFSQLLAMAGDGSAFAGAIARGRTTYPARIDASGAVTELPGFGAPGSAFAISDDGSVVAGSLSCEDPPDCTVYESRPFRWTNAEDPTAIGFSLGSIRAMSATGSIMVGQGYDPTTGNPQAFRLSGSRNIVIDEIDSVYAISADGEFIAGRSSSAQVGVLWSATLQDLVPLTPPPEWTSWGIDVLNADGSVFAGTAWVDGESQRSFIWRNGIFSDLPKLPGADYNIIAGISSNGTVLAGLSGTNSVQRAFLWDETNGIRTVLAETVARGLELPVDLELISVDFLSNDGRILVGWKSGGNAFWRVTLLP